MMLLYHLPRVVAVSVGVVSAVYISACTTPSSEVVKLGPDTYRISTSAAAVRGGSVEAKRIALSQANDFCEKIGKQAFVTDFKTSKNYAEVDFRCEDREGR
jgi:hypothetical protein